MSIVHLHSVDPNMINACREFTLLFCGTALICSLIYVVGRCVSR